MVPNDANDPFLQRLRSTFRIEAEEHIQAISSALLSLERSQSADDAVHLESAFRHFHSLKGAARAVNIFQIEKLCQVSESVLERWKESGSAPAAQPGFDALHEVLNGISKAIPDSKGGIEPIPTALMNTLLASLDREISSDQKAPSQPQPQPMSDEPVPLPAATPDLAEDLLPTRSSVRVPTGKLDALLTQSEELLAVKMSWADRQAELTKLSDSLQRWENKWSKVQPLASFSENDVTTAHVHDKTSNAPATLAETLAPPDPAVWEFLEWNANFVRAVQEKLRTLAETTGKDAQSAGRLVDDLLEVSKELLMLPFSTVADVIPKIVRDLSRDQGKRVELVLQGADMEMDKRLLEELKDPLIHLVRNCIDHGIESPEIREQSGKSPRGEIIISAVRTSNNTAEITIADDGAGIDPENLKSAAIQRGLMTTEEAANLTEEEARGLVFRTQLTTSSRVTEISGRGMGLPIVQEAIQKLSGRIAIDSSKHGTTFKITLPLIFGTVNGLLIRAEDQVFIFPTAHIDRVIRIDPDEIKIIQDRDWITVGAKTIPFAQLAGILQLKQTSQADKPDKLTVLLTSYAGESVAFGVDEVLSVQELLVKSLKKPLVRVRNIIGASTLPSGQIVPILNMHDLAGAVKKTKAVTQATTPLPQEPQKPRQKQKILLAEDSMTSRMLLKGILETAGYTVQTAVDGVEAITLLRTEHFDLIISDVEMPRMNGFDLTSEIRKDRRLTEKPVVLVTALSSREDRERGIDVGANAYIVKSSFEQSNLLDTVRRLI